MVKVTLRTLAHETNKHPFSVEHGYLINEVALFCIERCPHKDEECKGYCAEFKAFEEAKRQKKRCKKA